MNFLFFTMSDKRSRDIESQALAFVRQGHSVSLLTLSGWSALHTFFGQQGWPAAVREPRQRWLPLHLFFEVAFLVRFCRKHRIDILHAHLDPCNLLAVAARFFMRTRVVVTRHHAEALEYEANRRARWLSSVMYRHAPAIVAVSANVKRYLVEKEGVNPGRVFVIPLSFDFALYDKPDINAVEKIRAKMGKRLTLITVGRFSPLKRIDQIIQLVAELAARGINCSLIIVGRGPEEERLKQAAASLGISDRIFFAGFTDRVMDYLAAADVYIHFSRTEATCTTVKEAALVGLPVIVCRGVGDFEEYIVDGENGFFTDLENPVLQAERIIQTYGTDPARLRQMGRNLRQAVLARFAIKNQIEAFDKLHSSLHPAAYWP